MSFFPAFDGTSLFFKDWGSGTPIVFSHAFPLSSDVWDAQMIFFRDNGFRPIAMDRRGNGRSEQTSSGHDADTYGDDLASLFKHLDLKEAILVGHSIGAGDAVRYVSRHGSDRVSKVVLIAGSPPSRVQSPSNPNAVPMEVFDAIKVGISKRRASFYKELSITFLNYNRDYASPSEALQADFVRQALLGSAIAHYDAVPVMAETDYTKDLEQLTLPVLLLHGEDDQMISLESSSALVARLVPQAELKTYPQGSHYLPVLQADEVNRDILAFIRKQ